MIPRILDRFRVRRTTDITVCRERTRAVAVALGLLPDPAASAATAAAEGARAVVGTEQDAEVTLEIVGEPRPGLAIVFHTSSTLRAPGDSSWDPLRAAVTLCDVSERTETAGSCELRLTTFAPPGADLRRAVLAAEEALAALTQEQPSLRAMRIQNRELARLLEEVRHRGRELERLNEELRDAHNRATAATLELRELACTKDELAARVAHDLRSPLAALRGALDALAIDAGAALGEDRCRSLELARRSAGHMTALVDDLLESSLLDAGLARRRSGPISLEKVLDELAPTITFLAREKAIAFVRELPDGLPHVLGDAHKIGQILANLLSNAIKFTPGGGIVRVSARIVDDRYLVVSVADSGIGIPAARIRDLFDRYHRLPSRATWGEHGTGLGLYICRQLVALHGGELSVESDLGRGTTFRFTLPYAALPAAEASVS